LTEESRLRIKLNGDHAFRYLLGFLRYCLPERTFSSVLGFEFPSRVAAILPSLSFLKRKDLIDDYRDGAEAKPMQGPFLPAELYPS
jgi:hypothetical protein